jgi:transcriptional regulator with XRE-family HTH domain
MATPETLSERVKFVLDRHVPKMSGIAFAKAAGLSQNAVNMIIKGSRGANPDEDTLRKIGKLANVSWYWLRHGKGPREPYEGDGVGPASEGGRDPYPTRPAALAALKAANLDPRLLEIVASMANYDRDPGEDFWTGAAVTTARAMLRRAEQASQEPDDIAPPKLPAAPRGRARRG